MKFKIIVFLLFSQVFLLASIGNIIALIGDAHIKRDTTTLKAVINMPLQKGDKVVTQNKAKLQVRFQDNTIITVGKNSTFDIEKYSYTKDSSKSNVFGVKFGNGIFKTVTGKIGKLNHKQFSLQTKTSTIGIRGTTVFVKSKANKPDIIACLVGTISVQALDINDLVIVDAGEMTTVKRGIAPTKPVPFKSDEADNALNNKATNQASQMSQDMDNIKQNAIQNSINNTSHSNTAQSKPGFFDPIIEFFSSF